MTKVLQEAISAYDELHGGQPNKQKRKRAPTKELTAVATPPDEGRWRSRSAVKTAASAASVTTIGGHSAGSTISSLTRSHGTRGSAPTTSTNHNDSSPLAEPTRRTRSSTMTHPTVTVESDSDEGSELNENDNAYSFADNDPESLAWGPDDESSSSDEDYSATMVPARSCVSTA